MIPARTGLPDDAARGALVGQRVKAASATVVCIALRWTGTEYPFDSAGEGYPQALTKRPPQGHIHGPLRSVSVVALRRLPELPGWNSRFALAPRGAETNPLFLRVQHHPQPLADSPFYPKGYRLSGLQVAVSFLTSRGLAR